MNSIQKVFGGAAVSIIASVVSFASATHVSAATVVIFTSAAPVEVERALAEKFTQTTGHGTRFTVGTVKDIQEKLAGAVSPDLVIMPQPALRTLETSSLLRPGSKIDLARVGIGIAIREGTNPPDISTPDAVRRVILSARSIAHPDPLGGGFAGAQVALMFARLDVAEAAKPKTLLKYGYEGGVAAVATGEADIGFFNISEILPVKGVTFAGPLPASLQSYIIFSGALHARAASPEAAAAFLNFLTQPSARAAWKSGGFEPPAGP